TQRLDVHVGQDIGFETEPALESLSQVDQKHPLRLLRLDAVDLPRRLDVAEVGEEARGPLRLHEQRRIRRVEAGEVADVDEVRDEQALVEPTAQEVESSRRHGKIVRSDALTVRCRGFFATTDTAARSPRTRRALAASSGTEPSALASSD